MCHVLTYTVDLYIFGFHGYINNQFDKNAFVIYFKVRFKTSILLDMGAPINMSKHCGDQCCQYFNI